MVPINEHWKNAQISFMFMLTALVSSFAGSEMNPETRFSSRTHCVWLELDQIYVAPSCIVCSPLKTKVMTGAAMASPSFTVIQPSLQCLFCCC